MDWLHTKWCKFPHSKLSSKAVSSLNRSCLGGVVSGGSFGWMNRGQPEWCHVFLLLKTGIDAVVYELISFRFIYMIYMQFIHRWWVWTQTFQLTVRSMTSAAPLSTSNCLLDPEVAQQPTVTKSWYLSTSHHSTCGMPCMPAMPGMPHTFCCTLNVSVCNSHIADWLWKL